MRRGEGRNRQIQHERYGNPILDMSRTAINVAGDLVACVLMERLQTTQAPAARS